MKPLCSAMPKLRRQQKMEFWVWSSGVGIGCRVVCCGGSREAVIKWEAGGRNQTDSATLIGEEGACRE
jgi:hypothetical protein